MKCTLAEEVLCTPGAIDEKTYSIVNSQNPNTKRTSLQAYGQNK